MAVANNIAVVTAAFLFLVDVVIGDGDDAAVGTFAWVEVSIIIAMIIDVVGAIVTSVLRWQSGS